MVAPELRAGLVETLDRLAQQQRGLRRALVEPVSPGLAAALAAEVLRREGLQERVAQTIAVLDQCDDVLAALVADGYPAMPPSSFTPDLLAELQAWATQDYQAIMSLTPAPN